LLEVSQDLESLRIDDFGAVVSSSGKNRKVFAESYRVDFDSLVDYSLLDDSALKIVVNQPAVSRG